MPPDPELVAETRGWLAKAVDDLRAAAADLALDPPLTPDAVFHAQQVAEKVMKAFLTWHSRPFRKTHNLREIGGLCAAIDPSLEPLLRKSAALSDYAWKFRYPGEEDSPAVELAPAPIGMSTDMPLTAPAGRTDTLSAPPLGSIACLCAGGAFPTTSRRRGSSL